MKLFAIHRGLGSAAAEGPEAARTGFSLAALVFGPLWLIARGLWLALAGYALAAVVVVALVGSDALRPGAGVALFVLGQLYLGLEGRALAMVARARNGRPLVDVVYARSALEAELAHLERAPGRDPPVARRGRGEEDILGLFPEAGR
jgi:hypothetical protein